MTLLSSPRRIGRSRLATAAATRLARRIKENRWTCPSTSSSARSSPARTSPYGVWLVSGAPATAEALGSAGFDFLVVDTEHTPIDPPQMADMLRAMAGTPASAVVRPAVERHGADQARCSTPARSRC